MNIKKSFSLRDFMLGKEFPKTKEFEEFRKFEEKIVRKSKLEVRNR